MKLDPKIKSRSDILTCLDIEEAKQFIGQRGYFSDSLYYFSNLFGSKCNILTDVRDNDLPFKMGDGEYWRFFIPESKIFFENREKKWRPYTLAEFENKFHIGLPIKFRRKGEKVDNWYSVLGGYWNHQVGDEVLTYIFIGSVQYTLNELFEDYEWQSHYTEDFQPFGVEE